MSAEFRCLIVDRDAGDHIVRRLEQRSRADLPSGDVLIRVHYSSLNYKDAMAATGNPAIARTLPHVPGIDAAGTVLESDDACYVPGQPVIATGHEIGVERWGGWSELLRVPADWLVPLPSGLTLQEAMILGTAGFTAAQCVRALQRQGVRPESGPVVVSGATGGVGSIAVLLLARLGYDVTAVTGKQAQHDWLRTLGAAQVAGRELLTDVPKRPLLSAKFAGGIDTVGGNVLTAMCKIMQHRGCVACCGVTGGETLALTVYPFILRGLTLAGIDSAWCPDDQRADIWRQLAGDWKPKQLSSLCRLVSLNCLEPEIESILAGKNVGRVVVDLEA